MLTAVGTPPVVQAAPTAPALAPSSACARFLPPPTADGRAAFRDLPILSPGAGSPGVGRRLSLAIRAEGPSGGRLGGGVAVGGLTARSVPAYAVTPASDVRVQARDPATGALADMPAACLADPAFVYGGMVWSLRQGDILDATVTSALDFQRGEAPAPAAGGVSCRGANLHTHGVGVSPYRRMPPDGGAQYGDYVFDFATPPGDGDGDPCAPARPGPKAMDMASARMTPMRPAPGGSMHIVSQLAAQDLHGPGGQPSGLFWYHPHTHGYAGVLTAGATTGAISIGDPERVACEAAASGRCAAGPSLRVRYLALRDAELAPDGDAWRLEHDRDYALEDACAAGGGDKARDGVCKDWRDHRWVFTVNGVRDPMIGDLAPGQSEVWRIVNASPNVTYLLSLRPLDDADGSGALPLGVLSDEGAAPVRQAVAAPSAVRTLLLMPGARAEVSVTPPQAGGAYALEQLGFTTFGDVWPAVRLAEVRFPASPSPPPSVLRQESAPEVIPSDRFVETGAAAGCGFGPQTVRRIYFVQRPSFADDRRKAQLYGLLAGVQESRGGPVTLTDDAGRLVTLSPESWRALLAGDPLAPAAMHNALGGVCTYLGHTETWVIENDTDEDHNFHIHQSEFQLALDLETDPEAFSPLPDAGRDLRLAASDQAVATADGRGRDAQRAAVLYQDTIPIPRGVSLGGRGCDGAPMNPQCRPGRVTIRIRFDRDEQIGTFVYHCHILQHEDNGMMATVRVLCPPEDKACAGRHPGY